MLKSFADAFRYLCKFTDYERMAKVNYSQRNYNLKRMARLLQAIGNPEKQLRCIHIAGTKGKGSTAMMLAQILATAGYKVGLYTSPHLVDLRERIQIWETPVQQFTNSTVYKVSGSPVHQLINKNDFIKWMNVLTPNSQPPTPNTSPTFFELMTAMSFLHFSHHKVDFAVIEVGLGGRLDATNLITPLVSVITRIDYDHTDKLGNTIKKIASEKAGIIKPSVPIITFRQDSDADEVFRKKAIEQSAPLCRFRIADFGLRNIKTSLLGEHQQENLTLALGTINLLNKKGITNIKPITITKALKNLTIPARLEIVRRNPTIIVDSAHNPISIKATVDTVKKLKCRRKIVILALSRDKKIARILPMIMSIADILIFTKTDNPRLLTPEQFITKLPIPNFQIPTSVLLIPNHIKAMKTAQALAQPKDLILITGSFYLAGPMRQELVKA